MRRAQLLLGLRGEALRLGHGRLELLDARRELRDLGVPLGRERERLVPLHLERRDALPAAPRAPR
ncbi:MAG: hypothetical protein H6745_25285 [Deltaproteobacteria bacterium]|nr:hypothetical protein [Deltaproteobacteria bacterium]